VTNSPLHSRYVFSQFFDSLGIKPTTLLSQFSQNWKSQTTVVWLSLCCGIFQSFFGRWLERKASETGYSDVLFREVELCSTLLIGLHISHPLLRRQSDTNIGFQNQGTSYFFSKSWFRTDQKKRKPPLQS